MPIELKGHTDYELISPLVFYNPETGVFTWKERPSPAWFNTRYAGKDATFLDSRGYLIVKALIEGRQVAVRAHRLAYFMFYGSLENKFIDHINRNRKDNSIKNLRLVSCLQNSKNLSVYKSNKTGVPGLEKRKDKKCWSARKKHNNVCYFLGYFKERQDAVNAINKFNEDLENGFIE